MGDLGMTDEEEDDKLTWIAATALNISFARTVALSFLKRLLRISKPKTSLNPVPRPRVTVWRKGNLAGIPAGTRWVTVGGKTAEFTPSPESAQAARLGNIREKDENEAHNRFVRAAEWGETVRVKTMIAAGADVNRRGKSGNTALMMAAWNGHTDCVKLLIVNGAEVNAQNNRGWTALSRAGSSGCVKSLIAAGADRNQ